MSFRLYASNQLESLSRELLTRFNCRQTSVFQADYVVTQTEGMGNWLKLQVAANSQYGIAANIRFLAPNDLIEKVYRLLGGTYQNSFSSRNLCWLIFSVLGGNEFISKFPQVAAYYETAATEKEVKRLALAQKLADLFDQYQIYRPELVDGWNRQVATSLADEDWQQYIWVKSKQLSKDQLADKTVQWQWILEKVKDPEASARMRRELPEIHVFGISILAPYHLQVLTALADQIDITFYFLNPAPQVYWYDTVNERQVAMLTARGVASRDELITGNNLLTGWGKVLKETFALLFQHDELLNAFTDTGSKEPATDRLLHRLQYDIFQNLNSDERDSISTEQIEDGSVTFNSCYTVAREVESLYNYLVHLIDQRKESLAPRDIVVMVTDIDAYAPFIKAVFDNAPYRFPYSISDESFEGSDNMVSALKLVLETGPDNFTAENILQLLDSSYIRDRFGISNLVLIRRVINAASIRFGIEGDKADDTVYVSWQYGLKRIIYGLCISGEEEYSPVDYDDSLFPLDIVEGVDSFEVIRFVHFVEMIIESVRRRAQPRPISGWVEYVTWVLNNLVYEADEQLDEDYNVLLKQLSTYNAVEDLVNEPISFAVFSHHFVKGLSGSIKTASFIRGGITFCSLIPMRSIPFKVIALLGLNFDKFPRRETRSGFDLMERAHRKGDRNVKDNDKHLFLETVLSAKDYLYISYIGQSVKDNEHLPASALVDELLDYIGTAANDPSIADRLIVRQPLHSFSSQYNGSNPLLYSYLRQDGMNTAVLLDPQKPATAFNFDEVNLDSICSFFRNPFKYYYNKVLEVRYDENESLLPETELFELDKLEEWKIRQRILAEPESLPEMKNRLLKTGMLPLKNMAAIGFNAIAASVAKFYLMLTEAGLEKVFTPVNIEVQIGETQLTGTIPLVQGKSMVAISFSTNDIKYYLSAYISFLAGVAAGKLEKIFFISGKYEAVYESAPVSVEQALTELEKLIAIFREGHSRIIPFYPEFEILPNEVAGLKSESFVKCVADKINNFKFPFNDEYVLHEKDRDWFNSKETGDEYVRLAEQLIGPLMNLFPTAKFNGK